MPLGDGALRCSASALRAHRDLTPSPYLTDIDNRRPTEQVGQVARIEPVSPQQTG